MVWRSIIQLILRVIPCFGLKWRKDKSKLTCNSKWAANIEHMEIYCLCFNVLQFFTLLILKKSILIDILFIYLFIKLTINMYQFIKFKVDYIIN